MHSDPTPGVAATVAIRADHLDGFRYMLREQVAGDTELLREVADGLAPHDPAEAQRRVDLVWSLADQVGGIY